MNHEHALDIHILADGSEERREPWVITDGHETLTEAHSGGVCVHAEASFEIARRGQLSGSLSLQPGSSARIAGQHAGSLHVEAGAVAEVVGDQSGSVHVEDGGLVRVHPGGKLAGSLHVAGLIENRGTRGGSVQLSGGVVEDLDGGSVKQPTEGPRGENVYKW
ncbi:hypothetical protein O2V63_05320 [Modestobacter sp. VKM Ac-2977]|uniref:hypothetical protein n=1 Tax=Modestobacter sp. VKM Ac-2977 TaxID=3004131 RepID=UPI0022AB2FDE|nr:hypothetical protein [Modestobacter sp. VKM Ac-2977]MCZ2819743.1 hypothetical protein [Modestobacter sp. VKM Ac-2977]